MNVLPTIVPIISSSPIFVVAFWIIGFVFWMQIFFIVYHLLRFGIGVWAKRFAFITFTGSLIISFVALNIILVFNFF